MRLRIFPDAPRCALRRLCIPLCVMYGALVPRLAGRQLRAWARGGLTWVYLLGMRWLRAPSDALSPANAAVRKKTAREWTINAADSDALLRGAKGRRIDAYGDAGAAATAAASVSQSLSHGPARGLCGRALFHHDDTDDSSADMQDDGAAPVARAGHSLDFRILDRLNGAEGVSRPASGRSFVVTPIVCPEPSSSLWQWGVCETPLVDDCDGMAPTPTPHQLPSPWASAQPGSVSQTPVAGGTAHAHMSLIIPSSASCAVAGVELATVSATCSPVHASLWPGAAISVSPSNLRGRPG